MFRYSPRGVHSRVSTGLSWACRCPDTAHLPLVLSLTSVSYETEKAWCPFACLIDGMEELLSDCFATLLTVACWLLCPWSFPGKNTGVGSISFSRGSSPPRNRSRISCICRWILYHWAPREASTEESGTKVIWASQRSALLCIILKNQHDFYPAPGLCFITTEIYSFRSTASGSTLDWFGDFIWFLIKSYMTCDTDAVLTWLSHGLKCLAPLGRQSWDETLRWLCGWRQ